MAERWWAGNADERYWLEATDREHIEADLRALLTDAGGQENWRYTLFREAAPGDVVFNYDGRTTNTIVGWSRIAGTSEPSSIVWKARGSYARERGAVPQGQFCGGETSRLVKNPKRYLPLADVMQEGGPGQPALIIELEAKLHRKRCRQAGNQEAVLIGDVVVVPDDVEPGANVIPPDGLEHAVGRGGQDLRADPFAGCGVVQHVSKGDTGLRRAALHGIARGSFVRTVLGVDQT